MTSNRRMGLHVMKHLVEEIGWHHGTKKTRSHTVCTLVPRESKNYKKDYGKKLNYRGELRR